MVANQYPPGPYQGAVGPTGPVFVQCPQGNATTWGPQRTRRTLRNAALGASLLGLLALGSCGLSKLVFGISSHFGGSDSRTPSGYTFFDTARYRLYDLGGGASVVRPKRVDGSLSDHVYDIVEQGGHGDIDPRYGAGPHLHRERADSLVTVEDMDRGVRRTVAQRPGSPIRP